MKTADWRPWRGIVAALIFSGCSDCDLPEVPVCTEDEPCTCIQDFDCPGTDECSEGICVPFGTLDAGNLPDGGDIGIDTDISFPDGGDTDTSDVPDTTDAPDARDTDTPDTDVPTDIGPDVPPNECGGLEALIWREQPGAVGDSCGDCSDGSLACDGENTLVCEGAGELNECGGCGELTDRLGVQCGECGIIWCEGGEAVCVDDLGDACPDPLTQRFRLEPSDGDLGDGAENDRFGWTVLAMPDGRLLVGAPEDDTSAVAGGRVFELADNEGWRVVSDIEAPDAQEGDKFGESIALDGATLVVGAPAADRDELGSGAVYVYERTADGWEFDTSFESPAALENGGFGRGVGVSGDWLAISEESRGETNGRVYIYRRSAGSWTQHSEVTGVGGVDEGDRFGYSLVLGGEELVVGAPVEADFRGGAHAFRLQGDAWLPVDLPIHPEVVPVSNFGFALALSEDRETLVISAYLDNTEVSEGGAIFTYSRTDEGWSSGDRVTAAVPAEPSRFGTSVAIRAGRIFVGAFREAVSGSRSGAVHVFEMGATGWEEVAVLDPDGIGNRLGYSVAVTPDGRVASGAVQDGTAAEDGGAVYVFENGPIGWEREDRILSPRALAEGAFSRSLAIEGPTVVVGADQSSRFAIRGGAAHVFSRTRDGWEHATVLGPAEPEDFSLFGNAMDMDEDWLVIGARNATGPEPRAGAVYVYSRTGDETFVEYARLISPSPVGGGRFGTSVAINSSHLIIGEDHEQTERSLAGKAWVFAFDGTNWVSEAELSSVAMQPSGIVGSTVTIDGDTALVGSPGHDDGAGAAFRFDRTDGSWGFTQAITAPENGANFGSSVAITDSELYIGASSATGVEPASGAVYVFVRGSSNSSGTLVSDAAGTGSRFGAALSVGGTLALVGADGADVAGSQDGTVTVFSSASGAWAQVATIDAEDEGLGESFGFSVSVNAGRALIGAVEDDVDGPNAGAAYVLE